MIIKTPYLALVFVLLFSRTACLASESFTNLLAKSADAYDKQNYKLALVYVNKAIEIETNCPAAYLSRGWLYVKTKQFDEALINLNEGIRFSTNDAEFSNAYLWRGNYYLEVTNYEKSIIDLSKAIQISPSFSSAYNLRAYAYILAHRYDLSIIDCNMAIWLDPTNTKTYYYKGFAYGGTLDYDKAIEAFSQGIKQDTNFTDAYYQRASAFAVKEDYTNAISDLNRVIQLDPTNANAYSIRGLLLSRIGDYRKGMEDCRKAIQLDRNYFAAYNNLAWLLTTAPEAKLRDGKKAVKYATRACELSEWKNAYCLGTLAAAYAEIGKFDEAIKWEDKCIQIGLSKEKEMGQARNELELFKQRKPYHADK